MSQTSLFTHVEEEIQAPLLLSFLQAIREFSKKFTTPSDHDREEIYVAVLALLPIESVCSSYSPKQANLSSTFSPISEATQPMASDVVTPVSPVPCHVVGSPVLLYSFVLPDAIRPTRDVQVQQESTPEAANPSGISPTPPVRRGRPINGLVRGKAAARRKLAAQQARATPFYTKPEQAKTPPSSSSRAPPPVVTPQKYVKKSEMYLPRKNQQEPQLVVATAVQPSITTPTVCDQPPPEIPIVLQTEPPVIVSLAVIEPPPVPVIELAGVLLGVEPECQSAESPPQTQVVQPIAEWGVPKKEYVTWKTHRFETCMDIDDDFF